jgi:hypothetical protein
MFGIVLQGGADLPDGKVEALLEVDERLRAPNLPSQVLPGDDFAGATYQHGQNLGGLALELQGNSIPPQFAGAEIQFEVSKADNKKGTRLGGHAIPPKASPDSDCEKLYPRSPSLSLSLSLAASQETQPKLTPGELTRA